MLCGDGFGQGSYLTRLDAEMFLEMFLDIFSPANYGEFRRVLSKDGILIKVVPTENHLKEIRQMVQEQLTKLPTLVF